MLHLDYRLSAHARDLPDEPGDASATDLRFRFALGDLILTAGSVDLSAPWGWVPLLDFAASIREITHRLRGGANRAEFEFTESEATLQFAHREGALRITASYAPGTIESRLTTFAEALRSFEGRLRRDLVERYPTLERHLVFNEWLPE